jgi:hypothetical protein
MMTNVNLPVVLSFESEDHVLDFIEAAQEIIPKIKYTHIAGDGYNCILYTRKDKNYRTIMEAASAPVTVVETPVGDTGMATGYVNKAYTGGPVKTVGDAHYVTMEYKSTSDKNGNKVTSWKPASGYYPMPTDPVSTDK